MEVLSKVFIGIGSIFMLYYILIAIYVSNYSGFSLIWLVAGFVLTVSGILLWKTDIFSKIFIDKKVNIGIICIFSILFLLFFVIESIIIYNANSYPKEEADYVVVLGARIKGEQITKSLKFRLIAAVDYLEEHPDIKVVVSGGQGPGEDISEALAMRNYLVREGIDSDRIIMEDQSTDTNENILYTKEIIGADAKVIIVSNGFHIFRATSLAKSHGFTNVQGLGARTDRFLLPNLYVREAVGVVKDIAFGNIKLFQ